MESYTDLDLHLQFVCFFRMNVFRGHSIITFALRGGGGGVHKNANIPKQGKGCHINVNVRI